MRAPQAIEAYMLSRGKEKEVGIWDFKGKKDNSWEGGKE